MRYQQGPEQFELNLIDTPGHVDFQYEVSRSLACCEGALLLVDAFQGVEAQSVANAYAAMEHDLKILPVINKIDLKHARIDEVAEEMEHSLGIDPQRDHQGQREDGVGRAGAAPGHLRADSATAGNSPRRAAGHGVRLALRRVPGRDHVRADHERPRHPGTEAFVSCAAARRMKSWKSGSSRRTNAPATNCRPARSAT